MCFCAYACGNMFFFHKYCSFSPTSTITDLQHNHLFLCQSVTMLNDSFGCALLLEVLFVFMGLTNTIMKILLKSKGIDLILVLRVILISSLTINFILICTSAESIRTVQRQSTITKNVLYFCTDQISFLQVLSHCQFIFS